MTGEGKLNRNLSSIRTQVIRVHRPDPREKYALRLLSDRAQTTKITWTIAIGSPR